VVPVDAKRSRRKSMSSCGVPTWGTGAVVLLEEGRAHRQVRAIAPGRPGGNGAGPYVSEVAADQLGLATGVSKKDRRAVLLACYCGLTAKEISLREGIPV
jgi:hypothetical protein